ncbi:MAG: CoA ester lyase [Pseudomonadota bacterium]
MARPARPYRSVLYIPASKERALEKAKGLQADAIIFDLEDAVAVEEKARARSLLAETLNAGGYGARALLSRINGMETEWGAEDLAALMETGPHAILLPKVETGADVAAVAARLDAHESCARTEIWAMMETPRGILNAAEIARAPRMRGFVMGTNDLAKDLDARFRADRLPLQMALQTCVLAARVEGIACIDGVYNAFRDEEGLRAECEQGRDLGMDGKTLIHPAQLDIANAVFAPTEDELVLARRQIAAFEEARSRGEGVAVVDGRIVENLHVDTARSLIAKADAIRALAPREAAA